MSEQESRDGAENPKTESAAEQVSPKAALRRLALAGIGVVATAADVTDEVFNDLVRRGEEAGRKLYGNSKPLGSEVPNAGLRQRPTCVLGSTAYLTA